MPWFSRSYLTAAQVGERVVVWWDSDSPHMDSLLGRIYNVQIASNGVQFKIHFCGMQLEDDLRMFLEYEKWCHSCWLAQPREVRLYAMRKLKDLKQLLQIGPSQSEVIPARALVHDLEAVLKLNKETDVRPNLLTLKLIDRVPRPKLIIPPSGRKDR